MKFQTSRPAKQDFQARGSVAALALRLAVAVLIVCAAAGGPANAARPVKPDVSLSLDRFGLLGFSRQVLETNAALLTVNYVDSSHVLLTFYARTLIQRRDAAASTNSSDNPDKRNVAALLLEWPSGKVLARTQWLMGDYGRYLWELGHGRFLLRVGNKLSLLDPVSELATGDAFTEKPLVQTQQTLQSIYVSADRKLVTLETGDAAPAGSTGASSAVKVTFLRVVKAEDKHVLLANAGQFRAPDLIYIPVMESGYLLAEERKQNEWTVAFDRFDGSAGVTLTPLESSCMPGLQFVSPSEYVAVSCRGSDDRTTLGSYDLAGNERWEERFVSEGSQPSFEFAPEAGRFAFSRVVPAPPVTDENGLPTTSGFAQEFRVYGNASGDLLLEVKAAQALRSGQNFAISADGLHFLVAHDGVLEQYSLPKLKKDDLLAVQQASAMAPPHDAGVVDLRQMLKDASAAAAQDRAVERAANSPATAASHASPAATAPQIAGVTPAASTAALGDPAAPLNVATSPAPREGISEGDDNSPRKPPTLLEPGEKPEFGEAKPKKPKKTDKPEKPADSTAGSSK